MMAGCASGPPRSSYYPSSYQSPVAVAPAVTTEDESSSFTNPVENGNARVAVAQAETAAQSVAQTIASFASATPVNCNSATMEGAISTLQRVDTSAQYYVGLASSAPELSDREAAMDVLDELNGVILDGLIDISKAYQGQKCLPRAKQLLTEAQRVYQGTAYDGWKTAMATTLQEIEIAERVPEPKPKSTPTTARFKKKK